MRKLINLFVGVVVLVGGFSTVHTAKATVHPVGTNVSHLGTVYFVHPDGKLHPYTSVGAFLSYGFNNWASIQPATAEDLALPRGEFVPPQDGKIMCDNKVRVGTCYLITEGWKIGFVTEADFKNLGFSFSRALWGDVWFLGEKQNIASGFEAHRPGVLINDAGTIYYVTPIGRAGFPSFDIFLSWGYSLADVVPANAADRALPQVSTIYYRQAGELNPSIGQSSNTVRLIVPNGNENWTLGTTQKIMWDNTLFDSRVDIYLNEYVYYPPCYTYPCPAQTQRPQRSYVIANQVLNSGEYYWNVGTTTTLATIEPGLYKVAISGSNQKSVYDESDYPFTIVTHATEAQIRDDKRLADIRQMASALELYYNDYNAYPQYLQNLSPNYLYTLPATPTPIDGNCTAVQSVYTYTRYTPSHYTLTFCLGAQTGGYSSGPRTLSEAGIQ